MDYISILIPFAGGLGMFIYGMQIMAQGLENAAGNRMKSIDGSYARCGYYGCDPELFRYERYGRRVCKCRDYGSYASYGGHHGS